MEDKISVYQAQARLERLGAPVTEQSIRSWCYRGILDASKIGGRWFIESRSVDTLGNGERKERKKRKSRKQ